MAVFEGKKSSNDIIINDIMSDDEVVASDVPQRYLLLLERESVVSTLNMDEIEAKQIAKRSQSFLFLCFCREQRDL